MSDIGSKLRSRWPEITLAAFATANIAVVLLVRQWEIVPFHLVWASLAVLIGLRVWTVRTTAFVLAGVIVATGLPLVYTVSRGLEPFAELSEVPLIAGIFVAMIWHAHRYQSAMTELRRLSDSQREFVRDASHELRTPITVASGHAQLILASSDPQAVADADIVLDELDRLSRLAEKLVLLAATDHPELLNLRPTEIGPFLSNTLDRWRPTADRDWTIEPGTDGVAVIDRERIQIALDALIENAVKFTGPGDRIGLSAGVVDGHAFLGVADTGPGIPLGEQGRVFERFTRPDDARTRSNGGTGLGLAIVKAIVEAHGGTVSLRSAEGRGASFRITLPAEPDVVAAAEPQERR